MEIMDDSWALVRFEAAIGTHEGRAVAGPAFDSSDHKFGRIDADVAEAIFGVEQLRVIADAVAAATPPPYRRVIVADDRRDLFFRTLPADRRRLSDCADVPAFVFGVPVYFANDPAELSPGPDDFVF